MNESIGMQHFFLYVTCELLSEESAKTYQIDGQVTSATGQVIYGFALDPKEQEKSSPALAIGIALIASC